MDRRFAFLSTVVLLAAGCQQSPYVSSHLELLGAERRALEDRVLDLEFELERAEKRLEKCPDEGGNRANARSSRPSTPSSGSGSRNDEDDLLTPSIVLPGEETEFPPTLEPPRVNEGRPTDDELPIPRGDAAMSSPRYQKPTRTRGSAQPIAVRSRVPGDPRITHLEINPTLTGGADFDRKSGDDGLIVVVEPRNAENEFVPLAGPINVVVLDYAKRDEGAAAMIARWDISAPNVHKAIVNDENARGIQLRLPWPAESPENSKLRLDVRYKTADGRALDARADVFITLPGQFSARWTPRAERSSDGEHPATEADQAPVNIARQPDEKESAFRTPAAKVIQSAFTTTSPEATADASASSGPRSAEEVRVPPEARSAASDARPTWQPNR